MIGFDLKLEIGLLVMEVVCWLESVVFFGANIVWYSHYRRLSCCEVIRTYAKNGLIFDLIACSPFVVILDGYTSPIWLIVLVRFLRI